MQSEFVVRVQADTANTYGLGEVVIPGVAFFRKDRYNLTKEQLERAIASVSANGGRIVK